MNKSTLRACRSYSKTCFFLYAFGAACRTKFQIVQSIVVLPVIGLKKKLTFHLVSTGGWFAVDIYDLYYMNITGTAFHEAKAYTQDAVSCKTNFPLIWNIVGMLLTGGDACTKLTVTIDGIIVIPKIHDNCKLIHS